MSITNFQRVERKKTAVSIKQPQAPFNWRFFFISS
jgi:hypothetical protein